MTLRLSRFVLTCCFTMGCLAPCVGTALESAVWNVAVLADGSSRLQSPTTYVIAARHSFDGRQIRAYEATIFAEGWSVHAGELTIDPTVDAVKITVLRNDATRAKPGTQE